MESSSDNRDGSNAGTNSPPAQPLLSDQPGPGVSAPAVAPAPRNAPSPQDRLEAQQRRNRRPRVIFIAIIVGLLLIAGGVWYYISGLGVETTDDAFTDGRVVNLAPQVSGEVVSLDVRDNQFVRAGTPVVHIDPRRYRIALEQAQAALASAQAQAAGGALAVAIAQKNFPALLDQAKAQLQTAQANLVRTKADDDRQNSLPRAATTQQAVDAARAAFLQAQAQVAQAQAQIEGSSPVPQRIQSASAAFQGQQASVQQAQAQIDAANLDLSHTVVRAPQDGWITRRSVEMGNYVTPGQQIASIVSPEVWIVANFKETQLTDIRRGQKVDIEVDAYPDLKLYGHVDSIQLGTGTKFSAFPPENATGNFVKVVQRVPVKIVIDQGLDPELPLPLGISVTPTVHVQ